MAARETTSRRTRKSINSVEEKVNKTSSSSISTTSVPSRNQARKSTGTRRIISNSERLNESNESESNKRRSSRISQNTTAFISQANSSNVLDSQDSDPMRSRRNFLGISQNTTMPISQSDCLVDQDKSDSEIPNEDLQGRKKSKKNIDESKTKSAEKSSQSQEANVTNLANQCVFYILVANRSKKVIKKRDIIQHVFDGRNSHIFPEVLKRAAVSLKKTFGFEIMELKDHKNEYLLVNILNHKYGIQEFSEYSSVEQQQQGFTFYILTLIFMNENSILEEELWKALEPLGIEIKSKKPHPIFGDVTKFVTSTLVKQMYLERNELSKDPPQYELVWGERAKQEVFKEDLLEFACKMMGDTSPEEWTSQFNDAKGKNQELETERD
ncbi:melanoma-associated antigen D4 [Nephila pilipes]|uniref:Melanoma-associated antigen D4 n=1 Tax=Nephila pilipes TaxID=299642 RepID=A0A8X6UKS5_NEPPI|nr:melanoma-associated antigen D4 [Nephila pilipes]